MEDSQTAREALESDTIGAALAAVRRLVEVDGEAAAVAASMESAAEHAADALRARCAPTPRPSWSIRRG